MLSILVGVVCHFSFSPYQMSWLAPLSIAILFTQISCLKTISVKQSCLLGFGFGLGMFISGLRWIHVSLDTYGGLPLPVTLLLMVLLCAYLALYPALACYLFAKFNGDKSQPKPVSNALLFASLWTVTELLRGSLLTGFPWLWLGYSQTEGILSQSAASIGVIGLSFTITVLAALAVNCCKGSKSAVGSLIIACAIIFGLTQIKTIVELDEQVDFALVQGNIAQEAKWQADKMWPTISTYMNISREHFDADIIIWPEAAMSAVESWVQDYLKMMDQAASYNSTAIITGIIGREKIKKLDNDDADAAFYKNDYRFYNAILTVGNDKRRVQESGHYQASHDNRYYKHQLLPIGEFVPFEDILRPLAPLFNLPMSAFSRGDWAQPNLNAVGYKIAPAICYEIAFPELVRANVRPDTNFIVTISNDAWFGHSIGPMQHMEIAQMRAIELGRPLLRVTNTGITAVVSIDGRISSRLPQFEEGVLRAKVNLVNGTTYYYHLGNMPTIVLSTVLIMLIGAMNLTTRRRRRYSL
ncbi:MAG: apolipoprotein N-acyltransferase [Psychrobium sp.]|nr:apolipoprotein N-acyltransferase [Psychrobium sp.]